MVDEKLKEGAGDEIPEMTKEELDAEMAHFFEALGEKIKDVPKEEIERGARKITDFIEGKIGWAELFNFTPEMLFQMAEYGYMQFKQGRYADAERVFKVLTVLDWNKAYYHSVMGAILQRQHRYGESIAEYTQAIELDPRDVVSYTNRGEIFMRYGLSDEARTDFEKAIGLDPAGTNSFANRARMLMVQMKKMGAAAGKGNEKGGA